jgi:uncharacterized protein YhdP
LFLRDPLTAAFTMEYQISGSWKDPAINKVDRRRKASPVAVTPATPQEGKAR